MGVVKVAGKATFLSNGKSMGTLTCAFMSDALAADSMANSR